MVKTIIIEGRPGTGKTTFLSNKILEKIDQGCSIDDILFTSFSRAASYKAINKKMYDLGFERNQLINFGTIYKLVWKTLSCTDENKIDLDDYEMFAVDHGIEYDRSAHRVKTIDEINEFGTVGEQFVFVEGNILFIWWQFLKNIFITNEQTSKNIRGYYGLNRQQQKTLFHRDIEQIIQFFDEWEEYKKEKGIYEFDDTIQEVVLNKISYYLPIKFVFIDEAHDFSKLKMMALDIWCNQKNVLEKYICYDPLQSIYRFTGSDSSIVTDMKHDEYILLPKSYRVPRLPWNFAKRIASSLNDYSMDKIEPADKDGDILFVNDFRDYIIQNERKESDRNTFMLLRRNEDVRRLNRFLFHQRLPIYGFGRTKTMWNGSSFRNIYNLLITLYSEDIPLREEIRSFVINVPAKLLQRGVKQDFKKRRYKYWGKDGEDKEKLIDDKISLFYNIFKNDVGSVYDVKDILSQPRVGLSVEKKDYLLKTTENDISARSLQRYLGTFHSSKGLEAQNIVLFDYELCPDWEVIDETKLAYVGVTRTLDNVYIVGDGFIGDFF